MQGQCPRGAGPEPDVFHTHIPCWGEADVSSWSVFAQLTVYFHRRTISIHLSIRSLPDDKHVTLAPKTRDLRNIEIPFMLLLWGFAGIFPPALSNNVIVWVILSHTFFFVVFHLFFLWLSYQTSFQNSGKGFAYKLPLPHVRNLFSFQMKKPRKFSFSNEMESYY